MPYQRIFPFNLPMLTYDNTIVDVFVLGQIRPAGVGWP